MLRGFEIVERSCKVIANVWDKMNGRKRYPHVTCAQVMSPTLFCNLKGNMLERHIVTLWSDFMFGNWNSVFQAWVWVWSITTSHWSQIKPICVKGGSVWEQVSCLLTWGLTEVRHRISRSLPSRSYRAASKESRPGLLQSHCHGHSGYSKLLLGLPCGELLALG